MPKQPAGLVDCANRPPMPPVASTTWLVGSARGLLPRAASTPAMRPSCTSRRRAATPSSTVIEGQARTAATMARMISRPVASPAACTMRRRPCAASRPSFNVPAASRSNIAPSATRRAMASGASSRIRLVADGSQSPSPAASVSATCSAAASSGPTEAATPPCAQALDASSPSGAGERTTHGAGARASAVVSPARPAPTMTGWSARCESALTRWPACARPRDERRPPRTGR